MCWQLKRVRVPCLRQISSMYSLISPIRAPLWQEFLHDTTKSCTLKLIKGAAICPTRAWTPLSPVNIFHFLPQLHTHCFTFQNQNIFKDLGGGGGVRWKASARAHRDPALCLIWWAARQSCPVALCQRNELSSTTQIPPFVNISFPSFAQGCSVEMRSFWRNTAVGGFKLSSLVAVIPPRARFLHYHYPHAEHKDPSQLHSGAAHLSWLNIFLLQEYHDDRFCRMWSDLCSLHWMLHHYEIHSEISSCLQYNWENNRAPAAKALLYV